MRALFIPMVAVMIGCDRPAAPESAGTVAITWEGSLAGELRAPASATWCPTDSLLEILALDGDIGLGLSLLSTDTLHPGLHPVLSGAISANWRPLAIGAFRWASDSVLKGFEATGGNVNVTALDSGAVSGNLELRLKLSEGFDTLRMTGSFDRVRIEPAAQACGRIFKPKAD